MYILYYLSLWIQLSHHYYNIVTGVGNRDIKKCALTASVFLQDSQFQSNTVWHILDVVVAVQSLRHTIVHI